VVNSSGDFLFVMASKRPLTEAAKRNVRRNQLIHFQCDEVEEERVETRRDME
jgi:hypothetical protein